MICSSEIGPFVSHCRNVAWLETLRRHVEARIAELGGVPPHLAEGPPVVQSERAGKHAADLVPVLEESALCHGDAGKVSLPGSSGRTSGPAAGSS